MSPTTMMGYVIMMPSLSGFADFYFQSFEDFDDFDLFARPDVLLRLRLPELAVNEDLPRRGEVGPGRARLADHPLAAGERAAGMSPENQGEQEDDDQGDAEGDRKDKTKARPELGDGGVDKHE